MSCTAASLGIEQATFAVVIGLLVGLITVAVMTWLVR